MPRLAIPLTLAWITCSQGRLVVRPTWGDGQEALALNSDGLALLGGEIQIGVGAGNVLVQFRDVVRPPVFEHTLTILDRGGLWIGDIEGTSGVELAAAIGPYSVTGWFDQVSAPNIMLVNLGICAQT